MAELCCGSVATLGAVTRQSVGQSLCNAKANSCRDAERSTAINLASELAQQVFAERDVQKAKSQLDQLLAQCNEMLSKIDELEHGSLTRESLSIMSNFSDARLTS